MAEEELIDRMIEEAKKDNFDPSVFTDEEKKVLFKELAQQVSFFAVAAYDLLGLKSHIEMVVEHPKTGEKFQMLLKRLA